MTFQLEKSLTRLSYIEYTDDTAVLGKRCKEVSIVRRRGNTQERGWKGKAMRVLSTASDWRR